MKFKKERGPLSFMPYLFRKLELRLPGPPRNMLAPLSGGRIGSSHDIATAWTDVIECSLYRFLELGPLHVRWRSGILHGAPVLFDDRR